MPRFIVTATSLARLALASTLLLSTLGCSRLRQVAIHQERHVDTLRSASMHYDSIVIRHDISTQRIHDTVIVQDRQVEYRYRLIHDTLHYASRECIRDTTHIAAPAALHTAWSPKAVGCMLLAVGCLLLAVGLSFASRMSKKI